MGNVFSMCCILINSLLVAPLGDIPQEDIDAIEERVIANRMAIQRWHAHVSRRRPIGGIGAEDPRISIDTYVDGERARQDTTCLPLKEEEGQDFEDNGAAYDEYYIWNEDEEIHYSTRVFPDGSTMALQINQRATIASPGGKPRNRVLDLRWIAWGASGCVMDYPMTRVLRNPRFVNRKMENASLIDVPCKKISFQLGDKTHLGQTADAWHTVWVAPEMGYSILEYELRLGSTDDSVDTTVPVVYRTANVVQEWKDSGIWFPVSCVHEKTVAGKVEIREEAAIEIVSLNEPLDPILFKAAALNVPVGTAVYGQPNPTLANRIWDGKQAVEVGLRPTDQRKDASVTVKPTRQWWLLLNAAVLALICAGCLWNIRRIQAH